MSRLTNKFIDTTKISKIKNKVLVNPGISWMVWAPNLSKALTKDHAALIATKTNVMPAELSLVLQCIHDHGHEVWST